MASGKSCVPFENEMADAWGDCGAGASCSQQSDDTAVCVGEASVLQRCGSASSVSSHRPANVDCRKRSLDSVGSSPASETKKPKGAAVWPQRSVQHQPPQQHQASEQLGGGAPASSLAPDRGLIATERLQQPASEDEDSACDTPLAPHFAAAIDSDAQPCDELREMLSHLYGAESGCRPSTKYLEEQHGPSFQPHQYLSASMRTTAVSWLVEVGMEFGLHQESLFLAVALLDRYLTATQGVARNDLQIISVACMLVAAKHEEERHPSTSEFAEIADDSFEVQSLLKMERQVLDVLSFRINSPTSYTFLRFFRHINPMQSAASSLASYLIELSLLDYEFLHFTPSEVAAAALLLALGHQEVAAARGRWEMPAAAAYAPLAARSGYHAPQLLECVRELSTLHARAAAAIMEDSPFMAVKVKYQHTNKHAASKVVPLAWLPEALCQGAAQCAATAAHA